jgi:hypothetical protein
MVTRVSCAAAPGFRVGHCNKLDASSPAPANPLSAIARRRTSAQTSRLGSIRRQPLPAFGRAENLQPRIRIETQRAANQICSSLLESRRKLRHRRPSNRQKRSEARPARRLSPGCPRRLTGRCESGMPKKSLRFLSPLRRTWPVRHSCNSVGGKMSLLDCCAGENRRVSGPAAVPEESSRRQYRRARPSLRIVPSKASAISITNADWEKVL